MHEVSAAVMAVSISLTINLIVSILVCVHFGHPHHSLRTGLDTDWSQREATHLRAGQLSISDQSH